MPSTGLWGHCDGSDSFPGQEGGRCQGRCRKKQVAFGVLLASYLAGRPGFRQTPETGSHGLIAPDQRSGWRALAAA